MVRTILVIIAWLVLTITGRGRAEELRSPGAELAQQSTSPPAPILAPRTETIEPVVVTATKIEEPLEHLGAAVTVITEDELKTYSYPTVGDALRRVSGLEVQRSGGFGKLTEIRIRGTTPQQVQVLIDGVRVKSPTSGDFDFSDLSSDQIERIVRCGFP